MCSAPRSSLLSTFVAAAIALASPLLSPSAHADLITNGGFEDGGAFLSGGGGVTSGGVATDTWDTPYPMSGWDVGPASNSPNVLASNAQSYFSLGAGGGPHSGTLAAVFPNTPNFDGYISQQLIGVVTGSVYKISFWLSNQKGSNAPNNAMTVNFGGTIASAGDPITGGRNLSTSDADWGSTYTGPAVGPGQPALPGAIPVPTGWTYYEFMVGAGSDDARLSFIGGNTAAGNLIDDVSVEFVAVPETSSFGMLVGIALLAFGTVSRVRRRTLATA